MKKSSHFIPSEQRAKYTLKLNDRLLDWGGESDLPRLLAEQAAARKAGLDVRLYDRDA